MIRRNAAVQFITYIINPTGGSTRNNKQHKDKIQLHTDKQDTIAGAAEGNKYQFIQSARQPGIRKQ